MSLELNGIGTSICNRVHKGVGKAEASVMRLGDFSDDQASSFRLFNRHTGEALFSKVHGFDRLFQMKSTPSSMFGLGLIELAVVFVVVILESTDRNIIKHYAYDIYANVLERFLRTGEDLPRANICPGNEHDCIYASGENHTIRKVKNRRRIDNDMCVECTKAI